MILISMLVQGAADKHYKQGVIHVCVESSKTSMQYNTLAWHGWCEHYDAQAVHSHQAIRYLTAEHCVSETNQYHCLAHWVY